MSASINELEYNVIQIFHIICDNIDEPKPKKQRFAQVNRDQLNDLIETCNWTSTFNQNDQYNGSLSRLEESDLIENEKYFGIFFELLHAITNFIIPILTNEQNQNLTYLYGNADNIITKKLITYYR